MIPKLIHQTWKDYNIPNQWIESQKTCQNMNFNYKYILWTDEDMDKFVKLEYPVFYKTYKSYKYHIQRCDSFRYLLLYKYGGIYLDLDIVCKKKLDSLLNYDLVLTYSMNIQTSLTNSFMMSIPKHPFFKYCIENLDLRTNYYNNFGKHINVMYSTGPLFLTDMLNKYGNGNIKNMKILNKSEFSGDCKVCNLNNCKGGKYFNHLIGNSWNNIDSKFYNFFLCNYVNIIILIIIFIIIFLLYKLF